MIRTPSSGRYVVHPIDRIDRYIWYRSIDIWSNRYIATHSLVHSLQFVHAINSSHNIPPESKNDESSGSETETIVDDAQEVSSSSIGSKRPSPSSSLILPAAKRSRLDESNTTEATNHSPNFSFDVTMCLEALQADDRAASSSTASQHRPSFHALPSKAEVHTISLSLSYAPSSERDPSYQSPMHHLIDPRVNQSINQSCRPCYR